MTTAARSDTPVCPAKDGYLTTCELFGLLARLQSGNEALTRELSYLESATRIFCAEIQDSEEAIASEMTGENRRHD